MYHSCLYLDEFIRVLHQAHLNGKQSQVCTDCRTVEHHRNVTPVEGENDVIRRCKLHGHVL